jgi:hypothetical protein
MGKALNVYPAARDARGLVLRDVIHPDRFKEPPLVLGARCMVTSTVTIQRPVWPSIG